jgi:hypothetical protein
MLTTDQKGAIAETAIALAAIKLGIGVSRPLGDERYDLIFDVGERLLPVLLAAIILLFIYLTGGFGAG